MDSFVIAGIIAVTAFTLLGALFAYGYQYRGDHPNGYEHIDSLN